jgi:hypothetical protein
MQAFCGFSAVFLAFIIPRFDRFCTVYRIIEIIQLALFSDYDSSPNGFSLWGAPMAGSFQAPLLQ